MKGSVFLFCSSLQLTGRGSPSLVRTICFTESTHSNATCLKTHTSIMVTGRKDVQCYVAAWLGVLSGGERIHVCVCLSPFALHLKPSQHCLLISYTSIQNKKLTTRHSGGGNGNPLQYSCLENPMDRGARQATVHGVTKSRTQLSDFIFFTILYILWCQL